MTPPFPNTGRTTKVNRTNTKSKPDLSLSTSFRKSRRSGAVPSHASRHLLTLADFLPPDDAAFVRELFGAGRSVAHLARLTGLTRHRIRGRIRRLLRRTESTAFRYVVAHRLALSPAASASRGGPRIDWPDSWPPALRAAAQHVFIEGLTMREAASRSRLGYYSIRAAAATIRQRADEWAAHTHLRAAG